MKNIEKEFETHSIGRLVLRLGIPAMAAQFFNIMYSMVDRVFVGNIAGIGELSLASVGVCAPLLTAVSAFAYMVGIGGSSIMSISLGKRDRETAQKTMNNAFLMLVIIALLVTAGALLFRRELLMLLGCSEKMYPLAETYFTIYISGTLISLIGLGLNQFILAQGYAREGMIAVVLGAVMNIVLDPLLISGFGMGVAGAALATVISQAGTLIYVIWFLQRKEVPIRVRIGGYQIGIIGKILAIGSMSFLITIMDNLILILLNISLRKYGGEQLGDIYIACGAVVQSFMVLVGSPGQGITSGCGTLYSYHYGAGNYRKVMQVFKYVLILCGVYIGVLCLISQIVPEVFVRLFMGKEEQIKLAASFMKRYTLGILGIAVQFAFVDGLTAMGKITYALPLSLFRKIIYMVCVWLLPIIAGAEQIFYAGTISDIVGASFTAIVFFMVIKPKIQKEMCRKSD